MKFFNHFLRFLARKETVVEIIFSAPIICTNKTPEEVSLLAHSLVSSNYRGFGNENERFNTIADGQSLLPIHL
jgi:hypothetical protein